MSQHIATSLTKLVRKRAGNVCEYCCLPQTSQEATFHVDHIQPAIAQGATTADNLALACVTCSLRKAARTEAPDPLTKHLVPLSHPRRDRWADHFVWASGWRLAGQTPAGRRSSLWG
ncbi:MAG: HNH endonuclease signature motif containing protein [Planctomycetota bacterium]|nr:HNH endonuclease signature motif containing protein [Planctomycetota bacterium]